MNTEQNKQKNKSLSNKARCLVIVAAIISGIFASTFITLDLSDMFPVSDGCGGHTEFRVTNSYDAD